MPNTVTPPPDNQVSMIDSFATRIHQECDNLERYGRVEAAEKIRAVLNETVPWKWNAEDFAARLPLGQ